MSSNLQLRVAIVGAGPAGIYAGNILANSVSALRQAQEPRFEGVAIDLFESLPSPYGLIRYGVAPDHPRIKGIVNSLHEMLDHAPEGDTRRTIRFIGNVALDVARILAKHAVDLRPTEIADNVLAGLEASAKR